MLLIVAEVILMEACFDDNWGACNIDLQPLFLAANMENAKNVTYFRSQFSIAQKRGVVKGVRRWSGALATKCFMPNPSVIVLGSLVKEVSHCNSPNGALCPLDRMHGHFWPPASQGVIDVNRSKNIKNHSFRPGQGHRSLVILFIFKFCYSTWSSLMVWQS